MENNLKKIIEERCLLNLISNKKFIFIRIKFKFILFSLSSLCVFQVAYQFECLFALEFCKP